MVIKTSQEVIPRKDDGVLDLEGINKKERIGAIKEMSWRGTVIEWTMAFQDVHILIPEACEHGSLHSKRDFVDVIKLRIPI